MKKKVSVIKVIIIGIIFGVILINLNSPSTKNYVEIGEVAKNNYFETTILKAYTTSRVNTGNRYTSLKAGNGEIFFVLKVKVKNIDDESRVVNSTELKVGINDKILKYDSPETILSNGFFTGLDTLNPYATKVGYIVFKIPEEIRNNSKWMTFVPSRNGRSDTEIYPYKLRK